MATRSPRFTPRPRSTLANRLTSRNRSQYVNVRRSPGSPSQISAALFRRAVRTWRSRQLTLALILPSTNHLANGGFHSSTRLHGADHSSSRANDSQNASGSRSAVSYTESSRTTARALNSADASTTRFSCKSASKFVESFIGSDPYTLNLNRTIQRRDHGQRPESDHRERAGGVEGVPIVTER